MSEIIKTGPFEGWTDIMPITETAEKKLRPCAFCGRMPKTIYAVFSFTRREVCTQVVCMHKGCPVEYTEAPALRMFSVMEWNARPIEDARAARIAELEAERNRLREVVEKLVQLYHDEHQGQLDNGLRIDGFYSHEWLGMILDHGA